MTPQKTPRPLSGRRKELKAGTLLAPLPVVMVTCGTYDAADIVTVAWTGITSTRPPTLYVSLRPERHSHGLISASGEFAVNLVTQSMRAVCDWCGMVSGRDRDKFADASAPMCLTRMPAETVACPLIAESPLSLECRVRQVIPLGSHDMFLADILRVTADEALFDAAGKLRLDRAGLISFSHGEYFAAGQKVGEFGFSVRKRKTKKLPERK